MEEVIIKTLAELESYFSKYSNGYLFRGQTDHYLDSNGKVSIPTSFSRHGCIPPLMFKWVHYSNAIIRAFGGRDYHNISLESSQAILQHYGWRSFFVDLTKSAHLACWFAANKYEERKTINMCEDFEENPVMLVQKESLYTETNQQGHIYIIDVLALESLNLKVHDLTEIDSEGGTLRFHVQEACLVGNLKNGLPHQSVIAHLEVNHQILVDYYRKNGIKTTSDVFPDRKKDFILQSLLNIPWYRIPIEGSIPWYRRGLELPEYDARFIKHLSPKTTLYNEYWIADNRGDPDSPLYDIPFYKISEQAYYANTNENFTLAEINKILKVHKGFVIELSGLINIVELSVDYEYEKGVFVEKISDDIVEVSGLIIKHPGQTISGIGVVKGWHYRIDGNKWTRIEHPDQCPCNNTLRHELQFSLLHILNESIKDKRIVIEDTLNYSHKDIEVGKRRT